MAGRVDAKTALLAGGGSGGHVFPGLAVASVLAERGWRLAWAGSEHGFEARLVPDRGVEFHALPARPVLGQGLAGKARAAVALLAGAWSARRLVRRLDADVVVGTGGYVSVPAMVGARLASRPSLVVEPNAAAGLANRWLSRLASEAALAYDETARQFACPCHTTGVPVRAEFFAAGELPPASTLSPSGDQRGETLRVLVVGGSQGARQLNELLPATLSRLEGTNEIAVVHQVGHKNVDDARAAYAATTLPPNVRADVVAFLDDMPRALAESHLVISRAGAITLAEICAAGRPSLLVPLSIAGAHQVDNARRLVEAGAAEMFGPGNDDKVFAELLEGLLRDTERLEIMSRAARALARPGAAEAIANRVEQLARPGRAS